MPWIDLLAADRVVLLVEPVSRDHVLDAAARLLGGNSSTITPAISNALRERETLASTGIGQGVAIPHARGPMFHQPRGAFLRLAQAVDFNASDGRPVDLVFAMCAPDDLPEVHLQRLAGIAERFTDPVFLGRLRSAADLSALRNALFAPTPAAD